MNRVRLLCGTTLLTLVLAASSAIAGQIPYGITPPPPPPPQETIMGEMPMGATSTSTSPDGSVTGNMPLGVTSEIDPVMEFTLSLLQSVLALF